MKRQPPRSVPRESRRRPRVSQATGREARRREARACCWAGISLPVLNKITKILLLKSFNIIIAMICTYRYTRRCGRAGSCSRSSSPPGPGHTHALTHGVYTDARTHAHTHAHARSRAHTRTHACTHARARAHTYVHSFTRTHTQTHAHTHARTHTAHTYAHTHTRTHAHAHAHAHTHLGDTTRRYAGAGRRRAWGA